MNPCEICGSRAKHKHHLQSKSLGGSNKPYNIVHLCLEHHDEVHRGNIILEGKFLTTNGYTLIYHNSDEKSITGQAPDCFIFGKNS